MNFGTKRRVKKDQEIFKKTLNIAFERGRSIYLGAKLGDVHRENYNFLASGSLPAKADVTVSEVGYY